MNKGSRLKLSAYRTPVALLTSFLALSVSAVDPDRFGGPTELQDTFLPAQLRYQSYPESARIVPLGHWRVGFEEDWTAHLAQSDTYLFDGESLTSTLKLRHSPWERWELGMDVPYTARFGGTADEFIEFVETTLNAKVEARYHLPRNTYNAVIKGNGQTLGIPEKQGLGDITVRAKFQLTRSETSPVDTALVGTFGLPTGEASFGGSGVSPGIGFNLQKPVANWLNVYTGIAGVYYTDNSENGFKLYSTRGMVYAGTAIKPFNWFELLFVYQIYSPLSPVNPPLDDPAHYYSITGRFFYGKNITFETGVVENMGLIENRNSSDVTFKFSLVMNF